MTTKKPRLAASIRYVRYAGDGAAEEAVERPNPPDCPRTDDLCPHCQIRHRPGSVGHANPEGRWVATNPHDALFSTATMVATHYWNPAEGWLPIFADT